MATLAQSWQQNFLPLQKDGELFAFSLSDIAGHTHPIRMPGSRDPQYANPSRQWGSNLHIRIRGVHQSYYLNTENLGRCDQVNEASLEYAAANSEARIGPFSILLSYPTRPEVSSWQPTSYWSGQKEQK